MSAATFEIMEAQEIARALAAVAAADGAIVDREVSYLDGFAEGYGVSAHAWFATPLDEVALARAVTTFDKRRQVLRLCVEMALCDQKYTPEEVEVIRRISAALAIGADELAAITAAVSPGR
jgi:uncharacterized tellurite resistance protein B-like protein